jgi:malate dehydrogenase (oxaloacetate-decarboxylating)(NADP+)
VENLKNTRLKKPFTHIPRGIDLLHNPHFNKGTGFTASERDVLGLTGLLPSRVHTIEEQMQRIMYNFNRETSSLAKYINMLSLQDRNETLFYKVVTEHLEEMMPILYTPTVGEACDQFGHIFRRARGLFITAKDTGRIRQVLENWPDKKEVRIIVVTDGERILGLGDLGADGMGIPIGKLTLYTACAGIPPTACLPITIDVGTNNEKRRNDTLYIGLRQPRVTGAEYHQLLSEFVQSTRQVFGDILIQFEDFATENAITLLNKYRHSCCCFNDDIQGTAAVTLAGIYGALRLSGGTLTQQKILFCGAGAAATGIADLICKALVQEGLALGAAQKHCWFFDSTALVEKSRQDLSPHKLPYAHSFKPIQNLREAIKAIAPTILIGVSGAPETFDQRVIEVMSQVNPQPIIFALSNPTSKAECTAEQAYRFSQGRAIFASGSPFDPVVVSGKTIYPGQGNNAYIFPGLGLGVLASKSSEVIDEMFLVAAAALASKVSDEDLSVGRIFPHQSRIREVSLDIAVAVARVAFEKKCTSLSRPKDLRGFVQAQMYVPQYPKYLD